MISYVGNTYYVSVNQLVDLLNSISSCNLASLQEELSSIANMVADIINIDRIISLALVLQQDAKPGTLVA